MSIRGLSALKQGFEYSEILIEPQFSAIYSRSEVRLEFKLDGLELAAPILVAPVDSVSTLVLITEASRCGILGFVHRFQETEERNHQIRTLGTLGAKFGVAQNGFGFQTSTVHADV